MEGAGTRCGTVCFCPGHVEPVSVSTRVFHRNKVKAHTVPLLWEKGLRTLYIRQLPGSWGQNAPQLISEKELMNLLTHRSGKCRYIGRLDPGAQVLPSCLSLCFVLMSSSVGPLPLVPSRWLLVETGLYQLGCVNVRLFAAPLPGL